MKNFHQTIFDYLEERINRRKRFNYEANIDRLIKSQNLNDQKAILKNSYYYIFNLEAKFGEVKIENKESGFIIYFSDYQLYIDNEESLYILNEIFFEDEYEFISSEKFVLFDIGGNVGYASVYFANFNNIETVYLFEPVKDSFDLAEINIKLNDLDGKVKAFNFGLGDHERREEFWFSKDAKGNTGIRGLLSPALKRKRNLEKRIVTLKDTSKIIGELFQSHLDQKLAIKIDAEGSEYEILENLKKSRFLEKVDLMIIEWHDLGPEMLISILKNFNFIVMQRKINKISGLLYAFKTN